MKKCGTGEERGVIDRGQTERGREDVEGLKGRRSIIET